MTPSIFQKKKTALAGLEDYALHNARIMFELHPRVGDWLEASPVLALVQPVPPVCAALKQWAAGGWRTKSVLSALHIPTALRKLDTLDVNRTPSHILPFLTAIGNERLGQHLSEWGYVVGAVSLACRDFPQHPESAVWMVEHAKDYTERANTVKDYFNNHGHRWDWSPIRLEKEHEAWSRKLRSQATMLEATKPENQISVDLHGAPEQIEINGIQCSALTKLGDLLLEGAEMQHCVGGVSFRVEMRKGEARFYHLSSDDGESTVMFRRYDDAPVIAQHYGQRNASAPESHQHAARELLGCVVVPQRSWAVRNPLGEYGRGLAFVDANRYADQNNTLTAARIERLRDEMLARQFEAQHQANQQRYGLNVLGGLLG